jgi:hypothetical protein
MNDPRQQHPDPLAAAESDRPDGNVPPESQDAQERYWQAVGPHIPAAPRKRKWIAGLLSAFVPGTGHFYLGMMQKGLTIMLLIILDIFAIVHFSMNMASIPLITLLALFLPIIYFYSFFDALLSSDKVNARRYAAPFYEESVSGRPTGGDSWQAGTRPYGGWLLVGAGALLFVFGAKPAWWTAVMDRTGTWIGGLALIAAGLFLYMRNSKK